MRARTASVASAVRSRPSVRAFVWSVPLAVLLGVAILVSATIGPVEIPAIAVARAVYDAFVVPAGVGVDTGFWQLVPGLSIPYLWPDLAWASPFSASVPATTRAIVVNIRLPRIVLAATVGIALAAAGTVMQGFFRNPLADPSIVGVSSGAAVGAVAAIAVPSLVPVDLRLAAFVGALVTAFGVYAIATEGGRTPIATLLLAGVAVQTFLGAVISYLLLQSGESLKQAVYWMMGHLQHSTWDEVAFVLPVALLGIAVLGAYVRELNLLLLGEEEAHHLGVEVERAKLLLLAVASVVTAAGVAVTGVIGFVGLIVPHAMRLVVGPDHRVLLPTSALAGGTFLVVADTIARSGPAEMPVGIVTAAVGAPFFLFLLRSREVHGL
ncbi:vitamin B12 ABC transporter permease BtuC [Natronoarchaeum philippinense]|uniref:vitamin B12 ABC transporter permease BtuC n=1 Tax=Natronoarchaeum philippinense TaxID=558529 RepID=UPI000BE39094|nr:vitamin B12 ABC transporter permease BtuC [Natronoarchaeum philippinense]